MKLAKRSFRSSNVDSHTGHLTMMTHRTAASAVLLALAAAACGGTATPPTTQAPRLRPTLTPQESGTDVLLQAVSPVDERVVWVSGHRGTFLRTLDGGETWYVGTVPGADSLEFRDVHAVDENTAYLLSAGPGDRSRIYKTTDGGRTWALQFRNDVDDAFFDCIAFWDADTGFAFSDAVDGAFIVVRTEDGGRHWTRVPPENVPAALPGGEGGFAASGTCAVTAGQDHGWIGTGAGEVARVLRTTDRGRTWSVANTPIPAGPSAGIATLVFRDAQHGLALGGDVARREPHRDNVAITRDGGRSWALAGNLSIQSAVYGASDVPGMPTPTVVAVGPGGMEVSLDDGATWTPLDTTNYWAVAFASPRAGWAVGPRGTVVRIRLLD